MPFLTRTGPNQWVHDETLSALGTQEVIELYGDSPPDAVLRDFNVKPPAALALSELNIEILCANSSQAKGRVERVNRTLQDRRVSQAEVVENKRLGAALALVKTLQDTPRPSPRVKSASEAGGYVKTERKSRRKSWLSAETTRTASAMVPPLEAGLQAAASGGPLRGAGP